MNLLRNCDCRLTALAVICITSVVEAVNVVNYPTLTLRKDDPLANLTTPEIIAYYGYPVETHTVVSDGYILKLFRIPQSIPMNGVRPSPVLLAHGFLGTSADWFVQDSSRSLPFNLFDAGYDVWLMNFRGTPYSNHHVSLDSTKDTLFWKFSMDEMGKLDLPTIIDYIRTQAQVDQIRYVGYSMGTSIFWICMHHKPSYNDKISHMVAMGPAAYRGNLTSPLFLAMSLPPAPVFELSMRLLFHGMYPSELLVSLANTIAPRFCPYQLTQDTFCTALYYAIGGFHAEPDLNGTVISRFLQRYPATSAARLVAHYGQVVKRNEFESYLDYLAPIEGQLASSPLKNAPMTNLIDILRESMSSNGGWNLQISSTLSGPGSLRTRRGLLDNLLSAPKTATTAAPASTFLPTSEKYLLSSTKVPTLFIIGESDIMTSPKDVTRTMSEIGSPQKYCRQIQNFNHLDFMCSERAKSLAYDSVLSFFNHTLLNAEC